MTRLKGMADNSLPDFKNLCRSRTLGIPFGGDEAKFLSFVAKEIGSPSVDGEDLKDFQHGRTQVVS
jgi:hypothetical protein